MYQISCIVSLRGDGARKKKFTFTVFSLTDQRFLPAYLLHACLWFRFSVAADVLCRLSSPAGFGLCESYRCFISLDYLCHLAYVCMVLYLGLSLPSRSLLFFPLFFGCPPSPFFLPLFPLIVS